MTDSQTRPIDAFRRPPVLVRRTTLVAAGGLVAAAIASAGFGQDINGNAIRDALDLRAGTSQDCDRNGVPDEADLSRPSFSLAVEHSNDSVTLTNVNGTAPIDFDADGDLDLVVAARSGSSNSSLTLWRNDGGAGFRFANRITVTNALCYAVRTGDLNGDGRTDIVAGDVGFPAVIVVLANGSGGFAAPVKLTASSRGLGLALADLDADGDLDIANPASVSNVVDVFRNNGNGTFAPKQSYACGQQPSAVAAGDVDGDGLLDLAVANSFISAAGNGTVSVLRNTGGGTFAPLTTVTVPGASPKPHDVVLADVDGDGSEDLLVSSKGSNALTIFENSGAGSFALQQTLGPLPAIASVADRFLCQDVDGDALPELAWADSAARAVHLYDNEAGSFTFLRSLAAGSEGPIHLSAADLVGDDGLPELVTANDSISSFSILRGEAPMRFDAVEHIRRSDSNFYPLLGDFTGDGVVDLASYATSDVPTTFRVAPGTGDGGFGPAIVTSLPAPAPLLPRDVNADGHLDILGLGNSGNRYVKLNNGDGTFGAAIFSDPVAIQANFQTADLNGDGHLDVLWSWTTISSQPHKIRMSYGDGTGHFTPYVELTTLPFLGDLWTGDLTGDGLPELFAGVASGQVSPIGHETFLVYVNQGDGTFGPYDVYAWDLLPNATSTVGNFAWVDIDGDGDGDLLGASGSTYLFRNDGGELADPVALAGFANYRRNEFGPMIADADADGDLDLLGNTVVSSVSSPTIFFNDGTGAFPIRSALPRYRNTPDAVQWGDVDGDQRPDVLVKPEGHSDWYLTRIVASDVADCNGNGVADACDLSGGGSLDEDGNGVPDECETPAVVGDLDGDGLVNGSDLAILLGSWGARGGLADLNGDGTVDAADLGILLGGWGG